MTTDSKKPKTDEDLSKNTGQASGARDSFKDPVSSKLRNDMLSQPSERDLFDRIIEDIVDISMNVLATDQAAGATPALQRSELVEWLRTVVDWRDVLNPISGSGTEGMPETGPATEMLSSGVTPDGGMRGDLALVTLQTRRTVMETAQSPERLRAFLSGTLAATLARLEGDNEGTAEERVDLVLMPLAQRITPPCSAALRSFVAGLRGYMEHQPEAERQQGWYQTVAVMGDWLGRTGGKLCQQQGAVYYHQVLSAYARLNEERVHVVANNLASRIDDLADTLSEANKTAAWRLCNRLHALSVAAALAMTRANEQQSEAQAQAAEIWACMVGPDAVPSPPLSVATILLNMANVPSSWRLLDQKVVPEGGTTDHGWDWALLFEAMAGVLGTRMYEPSDYRRIAATFFNAGVSALRWKGPALVGPRVRLNALGLLWSLRKSPEDELRALEELNGLDCAVNLFGALVDLQGTMRPASLTDLVAGLALHRTRLSRERELEFVRLEGSWNRLGLNIPRSEATTSPARLHELVVRLWGELEPQEAPHLGARDDATATQATARIIRNVLQEALGSAHGPLFTELMAMTQKLVTMSTNLDAAWRDIYGDLADPAPGQLGCGPLVEVGVLDQRAWEQLSNESVNREVPSLAAWLRKEHLTWLS